MVDINEYTRETTCEYKGELYSVRDNGAVMRHSREGKKARKLDNVWTFGKKSETNGYMTVSSHRVHIIVAKAFIPGNEDGKMIVDHIDTNRCNNRVENLRWLTRLDNALLNEATLKRITYLCGGDIQKFIDNPSCLRDLTGDNQDIMWMRTVTPEEAKLSFERISAWAKRPSSSFKMMQGREQIKDLKQWLDVHKVKEEYQEKSFFPEPKEEYIKPDNTWEEEEAFADKKSESLTKGALQIHFYEKLYFPLCPEASAIVNLDEYAKRLEIGKVIASSEDGKEYIIESIGWSFEWDYIQVDIKTQDRWDIPFCIHISIEGGKYIHSKGEFKRNFRFCDSPNVLQCGAVTHCSFPLCPKEGNISLEEYAELLQKDALFEKNQYSDGYIIDREIKKSTNGTPIIYVGVRLIDLEMPEPIEYEEEMPEHIEQYGDVIVFVEHGKVIHQLGHTYHDERYLKREFCKMRGQEWNDEEIIIDDYC